MNKLILKQEVLDAYDGYLGPEDVLENKLLALDSSVIRFDPSEMGGKKKVKKSWIFNS